MIYYDVNCFGCRKIGRDVEGSIEYKQVKNNRNRRHLCPNCKMRVQLESEKISGVNTKIIKALDIASQINSNL
ncbi:DUF2197 domain-containing protein [Fredinandcohnia humi]